MILLANPNLHQLILLQPILVNCELFFWFFYRSINAFILVNVDEPLTEEQRNERAAARNSSARRQLIPRSDVPETEERREQPRYIVERSNSPVLDDDDDESKLYRFQS